MNKLQIASLLLALLLLLSCMVACDNGEETDPLDTDITTETDAPETDAPETNAPETNAPESDTEPSETDAPEPEVPVAGDPVNATFLSVADTYVQLNSTEDFGSAVQLRVKSADSKGLTRRAFLRFDLAGLRVSEVERVTLRLYCLFAESKKSEVEARDYKLYAISSDWDEKGMVWDSQPVAGVKIADVDTTNAKKDVWLEVDVTEYVKANLTKNISFLICNEGIETETNHINIASREATGQEPQLVIEGRHVAGSEIPGFDNTEDIPDEPEKEDDKVNTTLLSVADTYVQTNSTDDFGAAAYLRVKRADAKSLTRRAFVRFDLSGVKISEIEKVTLRLYCLFASDQKAEIEARDYKLYSVSSDWNEMGMVWDTQPTAGEKIADINTTNAKKDVWIEVDVTDYIKNNLTKNISFLIVNDGIDTEENHINLGSREAAGQEPQLVIEGTYTEGKELPIVDDSQNTPSEGDVPQDGACEHAIYLDIKPATATETGYVMGICGKCDEIVYCEFIPINPDAPQPPKTVVEKIFAKADAHVQAGGKADTNFGTATDLFVKKDGNNSRVAFFTFDTVNATAEEIDSVIFRLCYTYIGEYSKYTKDQDYKLYAVSHDAWDESTLTWNKMLEIESAFELITSVKTIDDTIGKKLYNIGDWIEIDVTEYVKDYISKNPGKAVSFVLRDEGGDNTNGHSKFASRESASAPQLVFTGTFVLEPDTPTEPEKPTVNETVKATADAHVQAGGKADTNFGTATDLFVKKDGNNSRAAFFTFDPVNATADEISKVVLRLCYTFSGEYSTYTKNQAYKLYSVSPDSWAESTLTWNKMLEFESSFDFITDVKTIDDDIGKRLYKPGEWIEIDVTEYVKEYMEENSGKALSFVLRDEGGDNADGHSKFASRETENAPQLVFTGTFDPEP